METDRPLLTYQRPRRSSETGPRLILRRTPETINFVGFVILTWRQSNLEMSVHSGELLDYDQNIDVSHDMYMNHSEILGGLCLKTCAEYRFEHRLYSKKATDRPMIRYIAP
ncbi:hypothetical protein Agabi119p4_11076 [Agaricus bisporus var. burnettii]|uniref:Uncharacterized protein n=1 Tax=Agaricus bisporus var. burnettii TaxID=192524 RepID=A0A8H7C1S5_AGABI|nr:hypothetical protein Agabi119p4_11076 [Agaricus bisporus var. burnettii]